MAINYLVVNMPDDYTRALKEINFFSSSVVYKFKELLYSSPSMLVLYDQLFSEFTGSERKVEIIIKTLGQNALRERFAYAYLHHQVYDQFPTNFVDNHFLRPVIEFEARINSIVSVNDNRAFLLGLYFQMAKLSSPFADEKESVFSIPLQIIELLKYGRGKALYYDYILILLHHFSYSLGVDKLTNCLENKYSFKDLINQMVDIDQELLVKNLMNYACSIGAPDILSEIMV